MMIKASGRSALIVAAGLLVCFAGPLPARAAGGDSAAASKSETSTSGKSVRPSAHHWKRYAHRTRTAAKSSESSKASEKDVADAGGSPAVIPASVANANAQMTSTNALANALADSASAMTAKANTMLLASADKPADAQAPADAAVVASDQLNDVDRALQETPAKQQTVAMASAAKPVAAAAPVLAAANDSSTWDQTSLIGKIFIAFGALLTMASAARMFMA
jgi:hypothetical protein